MSSVNETNYHNDSKTNPNSLNTLEINRRARKNSINNRQFLLAISESNIDEVNILMQKIDINFKDQDGCTPLHWAVKTGDRKIIEILLDNGVNLYHKNNDHETPIDVAKRINRSDIVDILQKSLNAKDNFKIETREPSEMNETPNTFQGQEVWINPVHGYIYQLKVLMLFLHRGLSCKYSFRLGTEIKEAKKFDDLVFEYIEGNKKIYRLLQAKHKFDESKKITVDKLLTDPKGDYSLVKYFYSFQACKNDNFFKDSIIKDVIICTNIDFDFDDLKTSGIEIKKIEEKDDILDITSNEKEPMKYKFTDSMLRKLKPKLKPTVSNVEIIDFLNHLIFAVNQPNEEELGQILKKEIGREISFIDTENAYNKLLVSMMDLSLGKNTSMFLSHEEGMTFFNNLKTDIPIWFNIQEPVMSFTGRKEYFKRIYAILTKKFYACISGMGGVGKTELARKYVIHYAHEYGNQVVWINAESYRSAADSFRQLASDKLNICLQTSDGKDKHITSIITDVYQFFSKGKSLFIFDNAEKYKCKDEFDCGIEKFLPCLPDSCVKPNIIITSRYQTWPKSIKVILLEAFNGKESRELVIKTLALGSEESKDVIDQLCKKLQFLPLALQQTIAYIKMQKEKMACIESNFNISNYLQKFSDMTQELLDFEFSEYSDSSYNRSVFTTLNITFDAFKEKENGKDALDILNIISYFLPENIPVELLFIFLSNKEKLSSAITLLKQYSLVTVQHKALRVHRLVQQVTRIKLQKQSDEVNVLQNTLMLLKQENVNHKNIDHVISMWTFARKHKQLLKEYLRLSSLIIKELHHCARYEEGISIGKEVSTLVKEYPNDNLVIVATLSIQNSVALCKLGKGEYQKAFQNLQVLHKLEKVMLAPSDKQLLASKNNMAIALHKLGRNREALNSYLEVLDTYKRNNVEESHPDVLSTKCSVSCLLFEEGKLEEALSMLQEIYRLQKEILGDRHADTLKSKINLASFLGEMDRTEESLKMLNEVCIDQEAILPKNDPHILCTKNSIASALVAQNKYTPAMKIFKELFDIQYKQLGENHPDVINAKVRMAVVLKLQNEYEEALKIYRDAFDRQKITLGLMHPETLETQSEIAEIFFRQNKFTDALQIFKGLLDNQMSVLGENHPNTLQTRRNVVLTLRALKEYDAALKYSLKTLNIVERIFGVNHPSTLTEKSNVGMMFYLNEDFEKALAILTEVLESQEKLLGKDHEDCQGTKKSIAAILTVRAKFDRQNDACFSAMERFMKKKGFDISGRDTEGKTMLHHAVGAVDELGVKLLLKRGAEIFVTSNKGNTPLHIAVLRGHERLVKLLLQKLEPGLLKDFVDVKTTSSASTALHVAAKSGYFNIVKCLLKSHATFCAKNKDGKTPLDLSTDPKIKNFLKMVHELFEDVKQVNTIDFIRKLNTLPTDEFLAIMNTHNDQGSTLSQVAIINNRKTVAAQILKMMQKSQGNE